MKNNERIESNLKIKNLIEFEPIIKFFKTFKSLLQWKNKIKTLNLLVLLNFLVIHSNFHLNLLLLNLTLVVYLNLYYGYDKGNVYNDRKIREIEQDLIDLSNQNFHFDELIQLSVIFILTNYLFNSTCLNLFILNCYFVKNLNLDINFIISLLKIGSILPKLSLIQSKFSQKHQYSKESEKNDDVIYFVFEIFENQRWWMGLDWTHALLPGERPNWSDLNLNLSLPPTTFQLPNSTSHQDINFTWKWFDDQWKVASPGHKSPFIILPLPNVNSDDDDSSPSIRHSISNKLIHSHSHSNSYSNSQQSQQNSQLSHQSQSQSSSQQQQQSSQSLNVNLETPVDNHGWSYGDNQWERWSNKNGIGCYTRRRRWFRVATLTQTKPSLN